MASPSQIPPVNKIFLVGIWVETALWGVNTIVFAGICYVLFWRSKANNNRHWVLVITSFSLYLCATLHVSASLRQQLEAFVYTPPNAPPDYASLYFVQEGSKIAAMKNVLYVTAAFIQDLVLIWRMYVVWGRRWKIVILPLVVELGHIGCAYAAAILLTKPATGIYSPIQSTLSLLGWPMELVVNISVAGAIIVRLWYMGRAVSQALSGVDSIGMSKGHTYARPMFTIIESGAIFVGVSITMLVLYKTGNPAALMCLDVATQVAALVPYLIILRVGLRGSRVPVPQSPIEMTSQKSLDHIRFAPNTLLEPRSQPSRSQWNSGVLHISKTATSTALPQKESIDLSESEARLSSQESFKRSALDVYV